MSLIFHILNVGHGSSVVVEFGAAGERSFGLIDSNKGSGAQVKAIEILNRLGAKSLSFVCLTHPHLDHYSGLMDVIRAFNGRIGHFFSFPMLGIMFNSKRLKLWKKLLADLHQRTDDRVIRAGARELLLIIKWAEENRNLWTECDGDENRIAPIGFHDVEIHTILPPRRTKGTYLNMIDTQNPMALGSFRENDISLALAFTYRGRKVLIGGDGCAENWRFRRMHFEQTSKKSISACAVNLPHHGSKIDCNAEVIQQLFDLKSGETLFAVTSADGQSHPDFEVIERLQKLGIQPYCTNLTPTCGGTVTNSDVRRYGYKLTSIFGVRRRNGAVGS